MNATIIDVPKSTKNADKSRDPEMHQTRKGNQWYFGAKYHVGVDAGSGMIQTLEITPANGHNKNSRSGVRGVFWDNTHQRWIAKLSLRRQNHYLGSYKKKEDTVKARQRAEEKYFTPVLEEYEAGRSMPSHEKTES